MRILFTLIIALITLTSTAQTHYAVKLIDKSTTRVEHYISNPNEMLSQRAITRRQTLNISLDAIDVPIDNTIIDDLKSTGVEILSTSKWLNTIFVSATDEQKTKLEALSFVKSINSLEVVNSSKKLPFTISNNLSKRSTSIYGQSDIFVKQIKVDFLHNKNFTGKDIQIAIFDAGFPGVNTIDALKELRDRGGILGTYNFVENNSNVYRDNSHGTMVLSTMAVNKPYTYIGTAYDAKYWLFTTEEGGAETPQEEFNWIEAIEYSDSVGVDVINCSLGYNYYDSPFKSYTIYDIDGETSYISRASSIGGQKGILVVVSAGNEGDKTWKRITMPADSKNTITVGAVNSSGYMGGFSSYGPSADGRIKPDISAMGVSVPVYDQYGNIGNHNGTSFSSPIAAGSVACLRQAFPNAQVVQIIDALHKSASNYSTPGDQTGYGIANFESAYNILKEQLSIENIDINSLIISPNPSSNTLHVIGIKNTKTHYSIYDTSGRLVTKGFENLEEGIDVANLKHGYYQLKIEGNKVITLPFIKKDIQ